MIALYDLKVDCDTCGLVSSNHSSKKDSIVIVIEAPPRFSIMVARVDSTALFNASREISFLRASRLVLSHNLQISSASDLTEVLVLRKRLFPLESVKAQNQFGLLGCR